MRNFSQLIFNIGMLVTGFLAGFIMGVVAANING